MVDAGFCFAELQCQGGFFHGLSFREDVFDMLIGLVFTGCLVFSCGFVCLVTRFFIWFTYVCTLR